MNLSPYRQNGNVVIFILLAVGLFGALAFTFMRNSQQSQGNMTEQQAKIAAQEIMDYSITISKAIERLRQRGCSETQISFDDSDSTTLGYENANSPVDKSCHIFDPAGANVPYMVPPESYLMPLTQASTYTYAAAGYGRYKFPNTVCLTSVGTCDSNAVNKDLVFAIEYLNRDVCAALNLITTGDTTPPPGTGQTCSPAGAPGEFFNGVFGAGGYYSCGPGPVGCTHSARQGYTFTTLILARP